MSQDPWGNKETGSAADERPVEPAVSDTSDKRQQRALDRWVRSVLAEQRATRRWGIFFKSLTFLYLFALLVLFLFKPAFTPDALERGEHTAIIEVRGAIADDSEASADAIIGSLREAFRDEHSRGVILRINSGGGSPVQAGYVYDEIRRLRDLHPNKPLYAVITDIGASGAYYIAAAADQIYADKASLVGSIGVISSGFGFVGLMDKLGVERRALTAGDSKALLDPFQPLPEEQKAFWQQILDTTHQQFIDQVRAGRGARLAEDPRIFSGLVWTGEQALELGLIDGLGSSSFVAREIVGAEKLVDFTRRPSAIEQLTERLGVSVATGLANQLGLREGLSINLQ